MAIKKHSSAINEVVPPPKDEEELELEKLVFGDADGFVSNLKKVDNLYDFSDEDEAEGSDANIDSSEEEIDLDGVQDEDLFFIDDGEKPETNVSDDDMQIDDNEEVQDDEDDDDISDSDDSSDAWVDSDDEKFSISLLSSDRIKKLRKLETDSVISGKSYVRRLRSQFEKIYPRPDWVDAKEEEVSNDEDSENETNMEGIDVFGEEGEKLVSGSSKAVLDLISSSEPLVITKQLKLIAANKISITRLKNANHSAPSKGSIQSIAFHHSHPLLLTGGFDRTLRIYHIDGKSNNLVTSLHLRNMPVSSCHFAPPTSKKDQSNLVFAAGRRRYMTKWDLNSGEIEKISRMYGHEQFQKSFEYFKISPKGNFIGLTGSSGWCNLLNGKTGQWVHGYKIEGTIVDFEFTQNETAIIIVNSAGEVWEFALNNKEHKLIRRWQDDSGVGITKIKLGGPKNRWLAIGSNNGIVNVYDRTKLDDGLSSSVKPIKAVENLVTSISCLTFSPDGQILVIASRAKKDALRLVHLPSCSVYSNWPTSGTPLGRVTSVAFSPTNEMLAIGNDSGKVTLWRLNHY